MQSDKQDSRTLVADDTTSTPPAEKTETLPEWRKPAVTLIDISKKTMSVPISVG